MRVAYLVNQYPIVSHAFIRREILALERRGVEALRISLRGWDRGAVDEEDRIESRRTRYVLHGGAPVLLPHMHTANTSDTPNACSVVGFENGPRIVHCFFI
jgi:hypothetical protein